MMTEVEHMMSLFLCLLHNDMTKNMSLPYVVIHTIIYLGDNLKMQAIAKDAFYGLHNIWGVSAPYIRPILEYKPMEGQHLVCRKPGIICCNDHNSFIQSPARPMNI